MQCFWSWSALHTTLPWDLSIFCFISYTDWDTEYQMEESLNSRLCVRLHLCLVKDVYRWKCIHHFCSTTDFWITDFCTLPFLNKYLISFHGHHYWLSQLLKRYISNCLDKSKFMLDINNESWCINQLCFGLTSTMSTVLGSHMPVFHNLY